MAKRDYNYFEAMHEMASNACGAAAVLCDLLTNLNDVENKMVEAHEFESAADRVKHEMVEALNKAFVTPLDREDIMALAHNIDDFVDAIEDAVLHFYMLNVTNLQAKAIPFAEVISEMAAALVDTTKKLKNNRKMKHLAENTKLMNDLEEKGDQLHTQALRSLFTGSEATVEIYKWKEIFDIMEDICDAGEHCADQIEMIIMKNS